MLQDRGRPERIYWIALPAPARPARLDQPSRRPRRDTPGRSQVVVGTLGALAGDRDALVARGCAGPGPRCIIPPIRWEVFFNILATFAEFEADLIRLRTREGMSMARAKGEWRGKRPKLSDKQHKELWRMYETGEYSISDLAELFSVSRPTVYRTIARKAQRS